MAVEWRVVWSSHIDKIGYDAASNELHVAYSGGQETVYGNVMPDKWRAINASPSIGSALHEMVRGKAEHPHRYV